ncbi:MAG: hypothetical protein ABSA52_17975 [Candidatus Binatia bacterium]|jgi:hypothetical protein
MQRTLYFDTNVYDHINKRLGVSDGDVAYLRRYLRAGGVVLRLSVFNLEEAVGLVRSRPHAARTLANLMRDLASLDKFFREPGELAELSVLSAIRGTEAPDPYLYDQETLEAGLDRLFEASPEGDRELLDSDASTAIQIRKFHEGMRRGCETIRVNLRTLNPSGRRVPFDRYLEQGRRRAAEDMLARLSTDVSNEQVDRLLGLRYPKAYIEASVSLIYSYSFEGLAPKPGDSRDLMHAGLAGLADVFVTQDRSLSRRLKRIQGLGYQVVDLRSLLRPLDEQVSPN